VHGDLEPALTHATRAYELSRTGSSDYARARTSCARGFMLGYSGDLFTAHELLREGHDLFTRLGDDGGVAEVAAIEGELAYLNGYSDEAKQTLQRVIDAGDLLADSLDWTRTRTILGWIYLEQGRTDAAEELLCAAFEARLHEAPIWFSSSWLVGLGLALAAGIAHARGDDQRAAVLLGAVQHGQQTTTAGPPGLTKLRHDELITTIAANLNEDDLNTAISRGAALSIAESLSYAVLPRGQAASET